LELIAATWSEATPCGTFNAKIFTEGDGVALRPSRNDRYAALLKQVSEIALECAAHFRTTSGQDVAGIIEFEHRADRVVDEIHELLDNSFIMRFDIPDTMRLTDELDDVIDGMRKLRCILTRTSCTWRTCVRGSRSNGVSREMLVHSTRLLPCSPSQLSLPRVREVANRSTRWNLSDKIVATTSASWSRSSRRRGERLGFIAWHQLFHLLEEMTDDANHCSGVILSLARKET